MDLNEKAAFERVEKKARDYAGLFGGEGDEIYERVYDYILKAGTKLQ